jgi:elongation of very long chain fatty acids protein 4
MRFHSDELMSALLHPYVLYGMPALFVLMVYVLAHYMTSRAAFSVKKYMQVYNVVQIIVCSYMVYGLAPCVSFPNIFGINSNYDQQGEWFVFVHYLSKYLDWFDTVWILLNKKRGQLSFLHVYHHATIGVIWGFLLNHDVGAGTTRYGAWVNSLTHVIMYSHYLWTSFGWKNPIKPLITKWQLLQFWSCMVHAALVQMVETTEVRSVAWLQLGYQTTMIYLFSRRLNWVPACTPEFDKLDSPDVANKKQK